MDNKDFENKNNEYLDEKPKTFWKTVGMLFLSFCLAVVTVLVINI